MQQKEKLDGQNKKKDIVFPEIPKKFATHQHDKVVSDVKKGVLLYENAITKYIVNDSGILTYSFTGNMDHWY